MKRSLAAPLAILVAAALAACNRETAEAAARLTGGDPDRGRRAIRRHGCASCHTTPGVVGARAVVGPPLDRIASRAYLAGKLPNTPENLIRWIRTPQAIVQGSAMPDMGIDEADGRDIAAYLYTLR